MRRLIPGRAATGAKSPGAAIGIVVIRLALPMTTVTISTTLILFLVVALFQIQ